MCDISDRELIMHIYIAYLHINADQLCADPMFCNPKFNLQIRQTSMQSAIEDARRIQHETRSLFERLHGLNE